ncbi:transcriptional regulator [Limnohabitans sp.]|uniref:transcriptional regulator n=1 Tax=Limnohabitans sp. TaxID=1907725 RepID=UPI00286F6055|nr:transcriptional regulator [Limnohabitans sp.]
MNEKIEFTQRLRAAMTQAGYTVSPSVLEHEFNLRWPGKSISNQAAWGWLNNRSIPTQDKMQVLAELLKIPPDVLRFGTAVRLSVQEHKKRWDEGAGYLERETFDAFLKLPAAQRKIIREVILTFAKVHSAAAKT